MVPGDLTNWMLVFVRIGALLAAFPVFNAANVPVQLRVALGALAAYLIAPLLPPLALEPLGWLALARLIATEIGIGLLLGFVSRLVFFALEIAGGIMATEMGLTLSNEFNPLSNLQSDLVTRILNFLAITLFLSLNMHHWLLLGLQRSYAVLPAGGAHLGPAVLADVVARTGQLFVVGVQIAAPLMATSFLISLIFAVLGRAVPQMNSFAESFSVRTLAGLVVFGMTLNLTAQHILNYVRRLPEDVLRVAQLMGSR